MKYTKEESNVWLKELQSKLDSQNKTISFTELWIKSKPHSIRVVVGTALNMRETQIHGKVVRKQKLGGVSEPFARSLHDMYLIVKHYFPEATIFDVVAELQRRRTDEYLKAQFCHQFKRMMFYKDDGCHYKDDEDLSKYGII